MTATAGPSSRAYAIVHLAMHDAHFGIDPQYSTYLADLPGPKPGADVDSAIAAAAHATLSALYPEQQAFFDARHAAAGLPGGQSGADGHDFGLAVAAAILALRQNDPGLGADGYASSVAVGGIAKTRTIQTRASTRRSMAPGRATSP